MAWITENWQVILIAVGIAVAILNAATKHWSAHTGFVRVALFLTEVLSILTSAGVTNGRAGKLGKLKPPLWSVGPKGKGKAKA